MPAARFCCQLVLARQRFVDVTGLSTGRSVKDVVRRFCVLSTLEDNVDVMRPTDRQTLGSQTVTHRYVRVSKHESFQQTLTQAYAVGRASARVFHHNIYNELRGHWTTLYEWPGWLLYSMIWPMIHVGFRQAHARAAIPHFADDWYAESS